MITQSRVEQLLRYDPDTGYLYWRVTKSAKATAGQIAGSVNAKGHVNLQIDKKMYAAHQLVFLLHHGYIPDEIDHRDRNKSNNRIENLRECTTTQNKGNIGMLRNNKTGYKGVSINSRSGKYHAQIKINGKQTYLGRFDFAEQAAAVYDDAAREHFGEFAYLNGSHT